MDNPAGPYSLDRRVAFLLLPLVGLASLVGGSVFWLRRVGWLQAERFWFSNTELIRQSGHGALSPEAYEYVVRHHVSLHQLDGALAYTKYLKEGVLAAFLLLAMLQLRRFRPDPRAIAVLGGLALVAAFSALSAALAGSVFALLAGARSFAAWALAGASAPLVDGSFRKQFARVLAWTLAVEALLVLVEVQRGMLVYHFNIRGYDIVRAVGTFNLPNSLASFAVVAWAAGFSWGGFSRATLIALSAALALVVAFTASATAWVALAAMACVAVYSRLRLNWRPVALAALLPIIVAGWVALPAITGRRDVQDSLWGRVAPVQQYASEHLDGRQVLFGTGFGIGTNALSSRTQSLKFDPTLPSYPVGDSTAAVLFWQFGLVGVALGYALFGIGLLRDPASRPIGIALLVSSASANITESFPINLVFGFWLAHTAFRRERDESA